MPSIFHSTTPSSALFFRTNIDDDGVLFIQPFQQLFPIDRMQPGGRSRNLLKGRSDLHELFVGKIFEIREKAAGRLVGDHVEDKLPFPSHLHQIRRLENLKVTGKIGHRQTGMMRLYTNT